MPNYDNILAGLDEDTNRSLANDPYYSGGAGVARYQLQDTGNPWANLALQALQGFTGGLGQGYGSSQVKKSVLPEYDKVLRDSGVTDTSSFDKEYDPIGNRKASIIASALIKKQNDDTLAQDLIRTAAAKDNGADGKFEFFNKPDGSIGVRVGALKPLVTTDTTEAKANLFGVPTKPLEQRLTEKAAAFMKQIPNLTANKAMEMAAASEAVNVSADKALQAKIALANKNADAMENAAGQIESAVQGSGSTGPYIGAVTSLINKAMFLSSESQNQETARQAFADPRMQSALKVRQPGSTSEREMSQYLTTAPGVDKYPQTNQAIADRTKAAAALEREYADFLGTYASAGATASDADRAWAYYKNQFPLFKNGELNTDRPDWRALMQQGFFQNIGTARGSSTIEDALGGASNSRAALIAEAKRRGLVK